MGKIVMPKNSALLEEVEAVLKIYNEAGSWISNEEYKERLKAMIGNDQYESSYTKKAQITSYFGFTEWEDIENVRSLRRITKRGQSFYNNIISKNFAGVIEDLMVSLEQVTFGRGNFGCPDSDSDIEPPVVFVRCAMEMGYLTYKEYAYLLWKLEDCGGNYTDAKRELLDYRNGSGFELPKEAQKYTDAKPIMVLIRWGFLAETEGKGVKQIIIPKPILDKYSNRISNLKIYNIDKNVANDDDCQLDDSSIGYGVEWFVNEAKLLGTIDDEAAALYKEFRELFAPDVLKDLNGLDILHRIFINETGVKNSLCHYLEYDKRFNLFGSVAGGSAYKYGLFYSHKENSWMTGSGQKKIKLSESEAIDLGTKIRDQIVQGAEIIKGYGELNSIKDYADLQAKLYAVMDSTIGKAWVMMYYHMIFPDLFPVFYNEDWQKRVLEKINIDADENSFIRMGQIALFVKKCGISNVAFSKIIHKIKDKVESDDELAEEAISEYTYDVNKVGAQNMVVYGTPGCGKSFYVQNTILKNLNVSEENRVRTTFYVDYTNTDFVGQVLPKVNVDKSVTYDFNPGPFTIALMKAIEQPEQNVALIIEELNRGNAPSIFGDIFQLLDRDKKGKSEYKIVNVNIQDYLNKVFENKYCFNEIRIPGNLYIIATMNTSDQNVFTLDTAFKRRWQFEKLKNIFTAEHKYKDYLVPGMSNITWQQLVEALNNIIIDHASTLASEDKQIGVYFITDDMLCAPGTEATEQQKRKFAYKLLEYIWDDVAKFNRPDWFGTDIKTLDQLIEEYLVRGEKVFLDDIVK